MCVALSAAGITAWSTAEASSHRQQTGAAPGVTTVVAVPPPTAGSSTTPIVTASASQSPVAESPSPSASTPSPGISPSNTSGNEADPSSSPVPSPNIAVQHREVSKVRGFGPLSVRFKSFRAIQASDMSTGIGFTAQITNSSSIQRWAGFNVGLTDATGDLWMGALCGTVPPGHTITVRSRQSGYMENYDTLNAWTRILLEQDPAVDHCDVY
ncbi:MAG: hypothetical protein JWL97_4405, partial [Gemmatimonadales bacterium]|nr:hypothetical protein [Gemmatimonadales bacterium]